MKKVFIVIAAYNEEKRLPGVIAELRKYHYNNIVVVDDGSKDNTYEVAKNLGVHALRHFINRGQGASLRTGIEFALENNADFIVTFDADGQHRAEDIKQMLEPVEKGEAEMTFGSRFLSNQQLPFIRKILLKVSIWAIYLFYGVKMTDAHNGFRVMSRSAAKRIEITCDRMAHASEIIDEVHKKHIKYKEVPVTIRYSEETMQKGHGGFLQAIKVLARMIVQKVIK